MNDYKSLFGYAAIIFGVGFLVKTIDQAYASPSGPNINMGSNPIVGFSGMVPSGGTKKLLFTVPSNKTLIITDVTISTDYHSGGSVYMGDSADDSTRNIFAYFHFGEAGLKSISKETGYPFSSNSELYIDGCCGSFYYNITGYYVHP